MKQLLTIITLIVIIQSAAGQGEVFFSNSNISRIATNSVFGGPSTGYISGAGNYYFALFVAPSSVTSVSGVAFDDANWTFTGLYGTNTSSPGRMNGNTSIIDGATVLGYNPGDTASFTVVGWSASIGSTLASVESWYNNPTVNGFFGQSKVTTITLGGGIYPASQVFTHDTTTLGLIDGFTVSFVPQVVPEPSGCTLIAFAALLVILSKGVRRC